MNTAPPEDFVLALQDTGHAIPAAEEIELERPIAKRFGRLGYELFLWRNAIVLLLGRLVKKRLDANLAAFVSQWLPAMEPPGQIPEEFCILLGQAADGIMAFCSASVPFAGDPGWWALLQLPALKSLWTADLRASHFEHLLKMLPRAWVIDPAPMVPGTVISGLNLPDWRQAMNLRNKGRTYAMYRRDGAGFSATLQSNAAESEWQAALDEALAGRQTLLVERPQNTDWWLARYAKNADGVKLTQLHRAVAEGSGWMFQKAAVA